MPLCRDPDPEPVPSPCVRLCTLDADGICVGCYRTLEDITAWRGLDPAGRRAALAAAGRRRTAAEGRVSGAGLPETTGLPGRLPGGLTPRG
ncbi:DUF1289 domain-containing protein [Azospirillum sp. TSO35-2]|uniref:DUF1289 domain-containing protein n=1 Tax=Azospirillum sp. TSO35-2 TaxID=716796 RepID=UPI000D643E6D|nr:DUF1289 domain-containing protein [Azospirillum sp. TSO35-2]